MGTAPKGAPQSGVFVVDISGLNLSKGALRDMEKAINTTVDRRLAGLDLRVGTPRHHRQTAGMVRPLDLPKHPRQPALIRRSR